MTGNPKDYSDLPNWPRLMTADLACRYVGWSRNGFAGILAAGLTAIACGVHAGDAEQAGAPVITGGKAESGLASEASEGSSRIELVGDENYSSVLNGPEIYLGSGVLVRTPARSAADLEVLGEGPVSLNFANADIREVINVVLGDTLQLNYIIHPKVQGTVTARTSQPLPRSAVISTLENILALSGAALKFINGIYVVVPLRGLAAGRQAAQGQTLDQSSQKPPE